MPDPSFAPPDPIPPFLRQAPDEMALPTETSKFGKVMAFLNRLNSAKNGALLAGMSGTPVLPAIKRGLTGQTEPSGAMVANMANSVLDKRFGGTGSLEPSKPWDKAYAELSNQDKARIPKENFKELYESGQSAGRNLPALGAGLVFDFVTDPLQALSMGKYTNAGKELRAVTRMGEQGQEGKLAKGLMEQLKNNQRSVASIGNVHAPAIVNKAVGTAGSYVGKVAGALPGADFLKTTFTPKFDALRTSMGYLQKGSEDFLNKIYGDKFVNQYQKTFAQGIKKIQANPQETLGGMIDYYTKELGLNPSKANDARLIMQKEIQRHGEIPILQRQFAPGGVADDLKDQLNPERVNIRMQDEKINNNEIQRLINVSNAKRIMLQQKLDIANTILKKNPVPMQPGSIIEKDAKYIGPQDYQRLLSKEQKTQRSLYFQKRQSDNLINELSEKYKDYSKPNIKRTTAALHNLRMLNDKTYDFSKPAFSEAKSLTGLMKSKYGQMANMAKSNGLPLTTMELDEYMGRALSPEAKQALIKAQGGSGGTLFNNLNVTPREVRDYTTEQAERMFKKPETRTAMFEHHFGNMPLEQKATLTGALLGKTNPGRLYEADPLKVFQSKAANSAKAVAGIGEFKRLMSEGVLSKTRDAFKDARPIDVPQQYQKAIGGAKQLYAPENVAQEFVKDASAFKPGSALDKFMRGAGKATGAFKVGTLFGTPIMGTSTAAKYLFGHAFIANTHNALSNQGIDYAIKAMPAFFRRSGLVEKGIGGTKTFESALDKIPGISLSDAKGIDTSKYSKYIRDGKFNLAKLAEDRGMFMESGVQDTLAEPGAIVNLPFSSKTSFLPKLGKAAETLTGTGLAKNEGRAVDAFSRLQYAATRIMHDGYDPHVALDEARTNLYDYSGGLSDVEQKLGRLGIPFYSWMRLNTPAMAKAVLRKPSSATQVEQLKRNIETTTGNRPNGEEDIDERFLPSFLNKYPHIRMFPDEQGRWHYLNLAHFLPMADLEDFMPPRNLDELRGQVINFGGSMNPLPKILLEGGLNKSLLFKKPGGEQADIETYPGEQGSILGFPMRKLGINAIEEAVPLVARLNRLNPGGIFGQQNVPNKFGATRDYAEMSTPEKFANLFALKASPTDQQRDIATAKQAYRDQISKYKSGLKKAQAVGQDKKADDIQKMIDELNARAIAFPSDKHKQLFRFSR